MIRKLIFLVAVCLFFVVPNALAQGGRVEYSSDFFPTAHRRIHLKGGDPLTVRQISEKLARHGAIVSSNVFAKVFAPTVELHRLSQIEGYVEAFSISVKSNGINISYTNDQMRDQALEEFYTLFDAPYGQRLIRGCDLLYYAQASSIKRESLRTNDSGVFDGVSQRQPSHRILDEINHRLKRKRGSDFILAVGNRNIFRLNFYTLMGINPELATVYQPENYTDLEILDFVHAAKRLNGNFVPAIDLLSPNRLFEQYTGHTMQSVEGQRFIRAMIEELRYNLGITKLCIGTLSKSTASKQYLEFLFYIANKNGMTLITL